MVKPPTWRARRINFMHRVHARRATRTKPVTAFVSAPEPRTIGKVSRGRQLIAGNFLFSGLLVEGPQLSIWDIADQNPDVADEIHGGVWLDDLAAVGDERARNRAQTWVFEWIARFGNGKGPGWTPDLVGRRLIRWINHGFFLLRGRDRAASDPFFESLGQQCIFLSKRWKVTAPGLPRFEALTGTIYAGLSLEGMEHHVDLAVAALAQDCETEIDEGGGITTRNPEELLEILCLLNWAAQALSDTNHKVPPPIARAIDRIAPNLRALRHADGGLARFHGGGRGIDGRLDEALAASGVKTIPETRLHMGYLRLTGGRATLIVDAAIPPTGPASSNGHASTLGMELTSGRRPIIVNCGSGALFGDEWRRASRATPSHSTLGIDGVSSSELAGKGRGKELLTTVPGQVLCNVIDGHQDRRLELSHDGYRPGHGLTHARILELSVDGRSLEGEDFLGTLDGSDEAKFDAALDKTSLQGIPYTIRFHLHPDVEATLDMGDKAVGLALKSGEVWVFRHDGVAEISLSASVYLENGRLKPRAAQQVVLSGRAMAYATRVRWSLAKAQDTPNVVRDFVQADLMDMDD